MNEEFFDQLRRAAHASHLVTQKIVADLTEVLAGPRHTGHVKWFFRKAGHGFIIADDPAICDGRDIFVHYTGIAGEGRKDLYENERVSFTLHDFGKGPQARDVRRLP